MNSLKASTRKHMQSTIPCCTALLSLLIATSSMTKELDEGGREASFTEWANEIFITAFEQNTRYDTSVIEARFFEHFQPEIEDLRYGEIENESLSTLFDGALVGLSFTQSEPIGDLMHKLVYELDRRSLTTRYIDEVPQFSHPAEIAHFYLVNARLLDLSADLEANFPGHVQPFSVSIQKPPGHDNHQPAILVATEEDPLSFTVQSVPIEVGDWFIAVVNSDCYFSRQATLWIEDNIDSIKAVLPENHIWISSQSRTRHWLRQNAWNSQVKLTRTNLVYQDEAWRSVIEVSATPMFYVLRNGVVVDYFNGWPGEERSEDLITLLERLGEPVPQVGATAPQSIK